MWTYRQSTGDMIHDDIVVGTGYAGAEPDGKNNPDMQDVHDVGPLPRGTYAIEAPINTKTHGPYVMWLEPAPDNQMFGRSSFGIHGDSMVHPGHASEGCICIARNVRVQIWESGDHDLEVVS